MTNYKLLFEKWLLERVQKNEANSCVATISNVGEYLDKKNAIKFNIFEISSILEIDSVINQITNDTLFRKQNKDDFSSIVLALKCYKDFFKFEMMTKENSLGSMSFNNKCELIESNNENCLCSSDLEGNQVKNEDVFDDNPSKCANNESEVLFFLSSDKQFSLLRQSLINDGIVLNRDFNNLNLWQYLNNKQLYSIQERIDLIAKINKKIKINEALSSDKKEKQISIRFNENIYQGIVPTKVLLELLEDLALKYPLSIRNLRDIKCPAIGGSLLSKFNNLNPECFSTILQAYINKNITIDMLYPCIEWVLKKCPNGKLNTFEVIYNGKSLNTKLEKRDMQNELNKVEKEQLNNIKEYILSKELYGATYSDLKEILLGKYSIAKIKELIDLIPEIMEINGKLIHEDSFVDLDKGAKAVKDIISKLCIKNYGITTASQLFKYVQASEPMFLSDNDIEDEQSVYDFARHLFSNKKKGNNTFSFSNYIISYFGKNISSSTSICQEYAKQKGSIVTFEEMESYLNNLGFNGRNFRTLVKIGKEPIFLIYNYNEYLLKDLISIDDSFFSKVKFAVEQLFLESVNYIIIRNIPNEWYRLMPTLPAFLNWTPLLFQQVLQFYSKEIGFRTIAASEMQHSKMIDSVIVKNDSLLRSFPDVIAFYFYEEGIYHNNLSSTELRKILIESNFIGSDQLTTNLKDAFKDDSRFWWDPEGKNVVFRIE